MRFTKLFLIALLLPVIAFSQKNFIGKPIRFTYVEVAQFDIPKQCTYDEALKIAKKIGDGWRLPNVEELDFLFKNRNSIGGFTKEKYWSSDIHTERTTAYEQYFNYQGFKDASPLYSKLKVRFVRTNISK